MLKIGDMAPDFSLMSDTQEQFTLSELKGKQVVLYFYPKDSTPGCTKEACDFRDSYQDFAARNIVVLGISRDSLKSHTKFRTNHSLPFPLLSDESGEVCKKYGVWVEKSMFGIKYFGIKRTTFLIDETGKIIKIWDKVKVLGHVKDVMAVAQATS